MCAAGVWLEFQSGVASEVEVQPVVWFRFFSAVRGLRLFL